MKDVKEIKLSMPPEWEKHTRTFMEWPIKESLCWPENYDEVCKGYAEIAKAIKEFEPITMLVNKEDKEKAMSLCGKDMDILEVEHNDAWMRDNGPTFVFNENKDLLGINWKFNAWGEKYPNWELDDLVAKKVLHHYNIPCIDAPFVLEGGSIHVDGEGTLLTTEECLLNKNRNPHLNKQDVENLLKQYLNVEKVIWLKRGLYGDETDGHIDNIACFARPGEIILQTCYDEKDPNYEITKESIEILKKEVDAKGRKFKIIELPNPPERFYNDVRLTLSYLNFYFVNDGIILPIFGEEATKCDTATIDILTKAFPNRKIKTIDGMSVIKEGGNVHCLTQQMPLNIIKK